MASQQLAESICAVALVQLLVLLSVPTGVLPSGGLDNTPAEISELTLDLALKFALDLPHITMQQQDTIVDVLLDAPGVAGRTNGTVDDLRGALVSLASHYDGVASAEAAAEVVALLAAGGSVAASSAAANKADLAAALHEANMPRVPTLISSARATDLAALAVDSEPALAYVLRREAEAPVLSRSSTAAATALALCQRGADVSTSILVHQKEPILPLVLAARFRDAKLCRCILARQLQQGGVAPAQQQQVAAQALLELLDHSRNRGWSVAISRSLMVVPAGGGSRQAFRADVMQSALAASIPLRRLHDYARGLTDPRQMVVRDSDVTEAMEAWALPVAAALIEHTRNSSSSSSQLVLVRDALGRTALHLAALDGWTNLISMLRIAPPSAVEQCHDNDDNARRREQQQDPLEQERHHQLYLDSGLVLATDIFGRTALHLARGRSVMEVLLNATAPMDRATLLSMLDVAGASYSDYCCSLHTQYATSSTGEAKDAGAETLRPDATLSPELTPAGGSGGWDETALAASGIGSDCGFDAINASALSAEDFASRFLLRSRPLLIRQAISPTSEWAQALRKPQILGAAIADAELFAGEIPYAAQFGVSSLFVRLGDFIRSMDQHRNRQTYYDATSPPSTGLGARPPPFIFHAFPVKHPAPLSTWSSRAGLQASSFDRETLASVSSRAQHAQMLLKKAATAAAKHSVTYHTEALQLYEFAIGNLTVAQAVMDRMATPMTGHEQQGQEETRAAHPLLTTTWLAAQRGQCHAARASLFLSFGEVEQALSEAEVAVQLDATTARSHGARCAAFYRLAQLAEASRDCTTAAELLRRSAQLRATSEQHAEEEDEIAYAREIEGLLSAIAVERRHRPLPSLGALVAGENATLPWFLQAEALSALASPSRASRADQIRAQQHHDRGFVVKEAVRQFIVSGRGGGAPAHPHSHAINSLAFGSKRWRMWRPEHSHFSAMSPWFGWHDAGAREGSSEFVECTQRGGDIMYVPASWGHSVLNIQDSVGQTTEFEIQRGDQEL